MLLAILAISLPMRLVSGERSPPPEVVVAIMLAMCLVLSVTARRAGVSWRRLFGRGPVFTAGNAPLFAVVAPLGILTFGAVAVVFGVLADSDPEFVKEWLASASVFDGVRTPLQVALMMILGVIVAPVGEEIFFRGLLMQRWAYKWGTPAGVVASSLLFALGHDEWIGSFLFGLAFCALYLRTRQLCVPIVAHAINNLIFMAPDAWQILTKGPGTSVTTLQEVRDMVPTGWVALASGAVLMWLYLHLYWPNDLLRRVIQGPVPYDADEGRGS